MNTIYVSKFTEHIQLIFYLSPITIKLILTNVNCQGWIAEPLVILSSKNHGVFIIYSFDKKDYKFVDVLPVADL